MHSTIIVPPVVAPGSMLSCSRCGHKWAVRKRGELPKNCPKCRSILWMKKYYNYTCLKCDHQWGTANDSPLRCPMCHTSKWNTPSVTRTERIDPVKSKLPADRKDLIYELYAQGKGSIQISLITGVSFGDVMDALIERYPNETINQTCDIKKH